MNENKHSLPWFYLVLDISGTVLLVVGVLALTGIDFGHPVLRTVAPGFIVVGLLLMVPIAIWAIRRSKN